MKPDPLYVQIADDLRQDIIAGVYKPDCPLPSIRDLAIRYNCSTRPPREALAELRAEGLVFSGFMGVSYVSVPGQS